MSALPSLVARALDVAGSFPVFLQGLLLCLVSGPHSDFVAIKNHFSSFKNPESLNYISVINVKNTITF